MTHLAFVNPSAGAGRAGRLWSRLASDACARGLEVVTAESADNAEARVDAAIARRPERLIAIGGDGTAHLVASRILAAGAGHDIVFGLVPAGTGGDLARSLGLPRSPTLALAQAREAEPRALDAIGIERADGVRRFAVNIASIGVSGAVDAAANRIARRTKATYLRVTLRTLVRYRPWPWRLVLDGQPFFDGRFFVAAFANGQSFGGGMRVAPGAVLDDGLADLVVVPPVPLWALPVRLPQFLSGRHVGLPFVRIGRGRVLSAEPAAMHPGTPEPRMKELLPPFDLDGETLEAGPAVFRLLPGALRVAAAWNSP